MRFRGTENIWGPALYGKKILVMGLGLHGGGAGTIKFLLKNGAVVTATDLRKKYALGPSLKKLGRHKRLKLILGKHRKEDFLTHDIIFKNPGVKPDSRYLKYAAKKGIPITSDIGFFLKNCPAKTIGVTGTRGKSTTVEFLRRFLGARYHRVFSGGNIRKSVLEILPKLKKTDWVVLELSSFQLHDLEYEKKDARRSPHIAVVTNILKDHLNWHKSFAEYAASKVNIFRYQGRSDYLFINPDDKILRKFAKRARSRVIFARLPGKYKKIVEKKLGRHYLISVALAVTVARKLGVSRAALDRVLNNFRGLAGREEEIALIRGVHFINDTTSTSPDALIAALNRFRDVAPQNNKLILICGGGSKGLDFGEASRKIAEKADILVLLPGSASKEMKRRLAVLKSGPEVITEVEFMREAVRTAYRHARPGDYIILSPGADSFNLFLNEFDRGDKFVEAVRLLKAR